MLLTPPASPKQFSVIAPEDRLGQYLADDIQLTSILGVGAYGVVYKAVDTRSGVQYAVKALNKLGLEPRQRSFQQREIQLHHQASAHPNVVSMVRILESADTTFVILEFCPEGDLFSKITEEGYYVGSDLLAKNVFLQILDAVEYCHSLSIYHRDLKPENILVTDGGQTVKLADFGLATQDLYTSDFGCGSTFYMSPECQQTNPKPYSCYASAANDVWSLGVILVNLTCGRNPWKRASMDDSTFRAYTKDRSFLRSILPISDELDHILARVFELNPAQRASMQELRHLIAHCSQFTNSTPVPASLPSPPYSPVDAVRDNGFAASCQVPEFIPPMQQLPAAQFSARPAARKVCHAAPQPSFAYTPPQTPKPFAPVSHWAPSCAPQSYFGSSSFQWCNQIMPVFNLSKHANFIPPRVF